MRSPIRQAQAITMVAMAALLMIGCEDSAVIPPAESTLSIFASPPTIVIDTGGGETEGTSDILASVFDSSGRAAVGVDVAFITTAGAMASNPTGSGLVWIKTDGNGYASDVLTMTSGGPGQAEVTALSGTLEGTVTVTKAISSEASAVINASPAGSALYGEQVIFSGAASNPPEGGQITCYKWTISDTAAGSSTVQQSPDDPSIERIYPRPAVDPDDLDLVVTLRVSDLTGSSGFCPECGPAAPAQCGEDNSSFSPNLDEIPYTIVCDDSGPVASIDASPEDPETGETVRLLGNSNDSESNVVTVEGYCQAPYNVPDGQANNSNTLVWDCVYDLAGDYDAKFVATNECGMETEVFLTVTVTTATP